MTRKELEKKFEELSTAIENHDYKAFYREPGGVRECLSPDDKLIVQVYDQDGPSHSVDFGGISVTVKGESFDCDLSQNEWSGSLFDEIDEEFGEDDEELAEELKEELRDILCGVEGYFCYEDSDIDCLVRLYELANDCTVDESYWGEDPDCPMALDDFEPLDKEHLETVKYKRKLYYIVRGSIQDEESADEDDYDAYDFDDDGDGDSEPLRVIAIANETKPNPHGQYASVVLTVRDGKVESLHENSRWYNSTEDIFDDEM